MDAIECGIVKLPRVPVADNFAAAEDPVYRKLWEHVGRDLLCDPRSARPARDVADGALRALLQLRDAIIGSGRRAGSASPSVHRRVPEHRNLAPHLRVDSRLRARPGDGETIDETRSFHPGALKLFANYDEHGQRLTRPNTLLIDSAQIEAGDTLELNSARRRSLRSKRSRSSGTASMALASTTEPTDGELLREVMNTIGRKGRLGEQVRCVVSVSMLTEGWDANTVTHILGVRAFGTQLSVRAGRRSRLASPVLRPERRRNCSMSSMPQVMGIPFAFTGEAIQAPPTPPKIATHVHAVPERAELEITFPRVEGFRVELPSENLRRRSTRTPGWF